MKASTAISAVLAQTGHKKKELVGIISPTVQGVSSKMHRDYWTNTELAEIAKLTGYKLAFVSTIDSEVIEIG